MNSSNAKYNVGINSLASLVLFAASLALFPACGVLRGENRQAVQKKLTEKDLTFRNFSEHTRPILVWDDGLVLAERCRVGKDKGGDGYRVHVVRSGNIIPVGDFKEANVVPAGEGFAICQKTGVTVYDPDGKSAGVYKTDYDPRVLFCNLKKSVPKYSIILRNNKSGLITFLVGSTKQANGQPAALTEDTQRKPVILPGNISVIDPKESIFLTCSLEGMFGPSSRMKLWKGSEVVVDLHKKYPGAMFQGVSENKRLYITHGTKTDHKLTAVDREGKELWTYSLGKSLWPGLVFHLVSNMEEGKKSENILCAYDDGSSKDKPGRMRFILIGNDGKKIADFSEVSYNRAVISPNSHFAMLTGKEEVWGVDLFSGKVLWKMAKGKFLVDLSLSDLKQGCCAFQGKEPAYWLLAKKGKNNVLLAYSLRTGKVIFKKTLIGLGWKMYPSLSGRTMWLINNEGRIISLAS